MLILCPVCRNRHRVPDNYDNKDFECNNSGPTPMKFDEMTPETILAREGYVMNRASTRENVIRPVTLKIDEPYYYENGERINLTKRRNW